MWARCFGLVGARHAVPLLFFLGVTTLGWAQTTEEMLKKERTVEEVRGVLSKVDLASHKLELIDTVGMMHEMNLATTASISVNGKESTLSALSAGNQVAISYLVELDGSQTAFWIDVTQSEPNPSSQ